MPDELNAQFLVQFHDAALASPGWPQEGGRAPLGGPWPWIDAGHRLNTLLWNEEDDTRRSSAGVHDIAASKRRCDRYRQQRDDAVQAIDEAILEQLAEVAHGSAARMSSETAGAMIDRLSVLALQIFHMRVHALRADAGAPHAEACARKLRRLATQRHDLAGCLDQLLCEAQAGAAYFKVYLRFPAYSEPAPAACEAAS